jgi:hypothetical protein
MSSAVGEHVDGGLQLAEKEEQLPVQSGLDVVEQLDGSLALQSFSRASEPREPQPCLRHGDLDGWSSTEPPL